MSLRVGALQQVRWSRPLLVALLLMPMATKTDAIAGGRRPWTVSDDIGVAHFGDPYRARTAPITFSPDGNLVAVHIERGVLATNRLEDELRVYEVDALRSFARSPGRIPPPRPVWALRMSSYSVGPLISQIRWTADSRQLAFLRKTTAGFNQLVVSDLNQTKPVPLTSDTQNVTAFDLRDRHHYAFTVMTLPPRHNLAAGEMRVNTGQSLLDVLFPQSIDEANDGWVERAELWAAIDGPAKRVLSDGRAIVLFREGQSTMALSPDGADLATAVPVSDVPNKWQQLFRPLAGDAAHTIQPGRQDLSVLRTGNMISEYAVINLRTGKTRTIASAPTALAAGWWEAGAAHLTWSDDGKLVALPSTFLSSAKAIGDNGRPCTAIADLKSNQITCVHRSKSYLTGHGPEAGFFLIDALRFTQTGRVISIDCTDVATLSKHRLTYALQSPGQWYLEHDSTDDGKRAPDMQIVVEQSLIEAPRLVARASDQKRTVWDPNPQLRDVAITPVVVVKGKDAHGRDWRGGLYLPLNFRPGRRYPLVLQTHGFLEHEFRPSGIFPTSYAARALASAGIMVLQLSDCPVLDSPEEADCQVTAYEAAIGNLIRKGIVDRNKVGIAGFSRTCFYVLAALARSHLNFVAASIADGTNFGYWQYLLGVDLVQNLAAEEANSIMAARPFGAGLEKWVRDAPTFNLDKITAPLLVTANGPFSTLYMWEPYAGLRYLQKPVELVDVGDSEHVLTTPKARLSSQGVNLDWFRFWLQGYERRTPGTRSQYYRWKKLCDIWIDQNRTRSGCVPSKASQSFH